MRPRRVNVDRMRRHQRRGQAAGGHIPAPPSPRGVIGWLSRGRYYEDNLRAIEDEIEWVNTRWLH